MRKRSILTKLTLRQIKEDLGFDKSFIIVRCSGCKAVVLPGVGPRHEPHCPNNKPEKS